MSWLLTTLETQTLLQQATIAREELEQELADATGDERERLSQQIAELSAQIENTRAALRSYSAMRWGAAEAPALK